MEVSSLFFNLYCPSSPTVQSEDALRVGLQQLFIAAMQYSFQLLLRFTPNLATATQISSSISFPLLVAAGLLNPETGTCPDIFDVYRDTHQRDDGTWVAPTTENLYRQMMEMKEKHIEEGEKPMSNEEIREADLGHKSGYVRGLGPGPKPTSTRSSTSSYGPTQKYFDNMKAQIEALTQMIVQQSYGGMGPSSSL